MTDMTLFFTEIGMSLILSSVVLMLITTPLVNLLKDLCHSDQQAFFWLAYTRTMLFISPLLSVILIGALADANGLAHIKVTLIAALGGLFVGLIIIGRKLYAPIDQSCETLKHQPLSNK